MHINISTTYEIGDVLFLEQSNGGGLRKVVITDALVSLRNRTTTVVLSNSVELLPRKYHWHSNQSNKQLETVIVGKIKYFRRGNTWLTEKPPKKRKPMTETSNVRWEQAAAKIMSEWGM